MRRLRDASEMHPCPLGNVGEVATGGVLKNFTKFTRKHLCPSLFFSKGAGLRPATLLKRGSDTGVCLWILRNF